MIESIRSFAEDDEIEKKTEDTHLFIFIRDAHKDDIL
jgi:hypothetical protein